MRFYEAAKIFRSAHKQSPHDVMSLSPNKNDIHGMSITLIEWERIQHRTRNVISYFISGYPLDDDVHVFEKFYNMEFVRISSDEKEGNYTHY